MTFNKSRQNIDNYITDMYSNIRHELSQCTRYENIINILDFEYSRLNNYKLAVMNEIISELSEIILSKYGINSLEKFQKKVENINIKFDRIKLDKQRVIVKKKIVQKKSVIENKRTNNKLPIIATTTFGGAVVGGMLKQTLASTIVGGGLGMVLGIGVTVLLNDGKSNGNTTKDISVEKYTSKVNKEYLNQIILERKSYIKKIFIEYIDKIQNIYSNIK